MLTSHAHRLAPFVLLSALLVACAAGPPTPAPGIIVDNAAPAMELEGDWRVVAARGSYGADCAQADLHPAVPNTYGYTMYFGGAYAYVRPQLPAAGTYEIFAWWCRPPRGAAAHLEIQVHPTTGFVAYQTAHVDLTRTYGEWVSLGDFYLEQNGSVSLSSNEGSADGAVVVDAFRFVYRTTENTVPTPTLPVPPPLPSPTGLPDLRLPDPRLPDPSPYPPPLSSTPPQSSMRSPGRLESPRDLEGTGLN